MAGIITTLFIAAFPLLDKFILTGDLSQTAIKVLALGLAGTIGTALFAYCIKYQEANGEVVTPVTPPIPEPPAPAPVIPNGHDVAMDATGAMSVTLSPEMIQALVNRGLSDLLTPPLTISRRVVTPTPRAASGKFASGEPVTPAPAP